MSLELQLSCCWTSQLVVWIVHTCLYRIWNVEVWYITCLPSFLKLFVILVYATNLMEVRQNILLFGFIIFWIQSLSALGPLTLPPTSHPARAQYLSLKRPLHPLCPKEKEKKDSHFRHWKWASSHVLSFLGIIELLSVMPSSILFEMLIKYSLNIAMWFDCSTLRMFLPYQTILALVKKTQFPYFVDNLINYSSWWWDQRYGFIGWKGGKKSFSRELCAHHWILVKIEGGILKDPEFSLTRMLGN